MAGADDLVKMVPGFEFLQTLMKSAGAALPGVPGLSPWTAPTLDPEELEKRIQELKTVQFWLDQNAKLLAGSIQALEVQRMTLATLKSLNLPLADLRDALKIKPAPTPAPAPAPAPTAAATPPATPAVDPLHWWSALTQQFTEIAAKAVSDGAAVAAQPPAALAPAKAASRKRRA